VVSGKWGREVEAWGKVEVEVEEKAEGD